MEELKRIVGKNLTNLRKEKKMTQLEVAELFNYSDKAVSKWENGDTLPDLETLYKLATFYGVTLDYLVKEDRSREKDRYRLRPQNKISITCLLVSLVWMLATIIYVWVLMVNDINYWQTFIWAVPVSCIVLFAINHVWGQRVYIFYISTVFTWSLITSCYLSFLDYNPWPLFILGIPAEICLILWVGIKDSLFDIKKKKEKK